MTAIKPHTVHHENRLGPRPESAPDFDTGVSMLMPICSLPEWCRRRHAETEISMSRLLSRIMLAILMLPAAALLYLVVLFVAFEVNSFPDDAEFHLANMVTAPAVAVYWHLIWLPTMQWHRRRAMATAVSGAAAIALGAAVGFMVAFVDDEFGIFVGGVTSIIAWLIATCFIWRESAAERAERLRSSGGQTIACLNCGYNMTGLREPKCPECGGSFSLDELLRGQRSRESAELSS
jgi:hypothetical protein